MKKGSFRIHVNEPCHEDWNAMTPEDRGRFCGSCQKSVTDFSAFTDKEIFNYIQQREGQKLCGRFSEQQLSRELHSEYRQGSYASMLRVAASVFLGALGSLSTSAQVNDSASVENTISQAPSAARQVHIKGQITSPDKGEGIAGAKVSIEGIDSTISDSTGHFGLNITTSLDSVDLLIQAQGWEVQQATVKFGELLLEHSSILKKDVSLQPETLKFQWDSLGLDTCKTFPIQPEFEGLIIQTMFLGSFITDSISSNYHTYPAPDDQSEEVFKRIPRSAISTVRENMSSAPVPDPEFSMKKTPKRSDEPPVPTAPPSKPSNLHAVLPSNQEENEDPTKGGE